MDVVQTKHEQAGPLEFGPIIRCPAFSPNLIDRLQAETETRVERVSQLNSLVDKLFPGEASASLRAEIKRSFDVPQRNEYHNEGVFMDTHLALIINTLNQVRAGIIDPQVPPAVAEMLQTTARANFEEFIRYTFLHDIDKPTCMTIKLKDDKPRELTTEEAYGLVPEAALSDCQRAHDILSTQGIESISYYQAAAERKHGRVAAERLGNQKKELNLSDNILCAIDLHEVAYQFDARRGELFRRHFGGLSADQQAWVLVASYIDLMGSLRPDGTPDISPFLRLTSAMRNSELVSYIEDKALGPGNAAVLDLAKFVKYVPALLRRDDVIAPTCEEALARAISECKISTYSKTKLAEKLHALEGNGLDAKTVEEILSCLTGEDDISVLDQAKFKPLRQKLGTTNALVSKALKESEINI